MAVLLLFRFGTFVWIPRRFVCIGNPAKRERRSAWNWSRTIYSSLLLLFILLLHTGTTGKVVRTETSIISTAPRVKPELAMPTMSTEFDRTVLEDLRNHAHLGSSALPSVCFYTFVNTHNNLKCVSISQNEALLVGGFFDSSLKSAELSGTSWYNLSSIEDGLVVSGSLFGALIGSIIVFNVADALGRRRELIVAAALYAIGALITALAPILAILIVGRFVFGFGIGLAMHAAPLYIAETSPPQIRGRLVSLKEFFIVIGILLGYLVSSLAVDAVGGWRYMYGVSTPIAVVMAVGMWWLPPSPRWILLRAVQGKGNVEELKEKAISALNRLRGRPVDDRASDRQIEENFRSLQYVYEQQVQEASFWEVFQGSSLKALLIGGGLVFFQQVTGQPSVLYYAATILQDAGFSAASDATRVSVILGFLKLLMTGVAVLKVDQLGRRPLLIGGVSGIVVSLFVLAAYYAFLGSVPIVAVIALLLYVGCYQVSFGPIGWLMISKIFPLRMRGRGISVAVLVNFSANALVTFSFSPLRELLGAAVVFLIFGVIAVMALSFIIFCVPETKGLSLEEIESKILK